MAVNPRPDGYHAVTPYLVVNAAATLIDFLKHVFNAQEVMRLAAPEGRIGHAEVRIGDSVVMLGDARQLLHHDASGADVEMTDLGIAHLTVRQPDIEA